MPNYQVIDLLRDAIVRPSVTGRSSTKMAEPRITQTSPYDSLETLVCRCQKSRWNLHKFNSCLNWWILSFLSSVVRMDTKIHLERICEINRQQIMSSRIDELTFDLRTWPASLTLSWHFLGHVQVQGQRRKTKSRQLLRWRWWRKADLNLKL